MKQAETEPKEPQWKDQPIAALGGRTWAELETSRHDSGRLLFKDQLRRRGPTGELEAIEVRVAVPTPTDHVLARAEARAWFGRHKELDADRDAEIFDELEQICLLARAVRTAKAPHPQLADAAELGGYDEGSLQDLLGRMQVYKRLLDPRETVVDEHAFWMKIVAVARAGHLGPLTDIAGHEQPSFIVRMAEEASSSPRASAYVLQPESSTPAP